MQLTIEEALEQGYKFCTPLWDETTLINIKDCDFKVPYVLIEKETRPFQISDGLILDLLNDYLDSQDEVADETGLLNDIAAKVDYADITKKLNDAFAADTKYYFPTDIELINR